MSNQVKIKAPAKINLTLDVIGCRSNGYHDLKMIMQTIDIYDELTIKQTGFPHIHLSMEPELPDLPAEKNLVYRAAQLMQKKFSLPCGFQIEVKKNIPSAAGLAGGSSDCAATLLGINKLCGLSLSKEELCDLGLTLGADVPFCIKQGTMLSEGIGEILTPLPALPPLWALLIKPNFSLSTGAVYTQLDSIHLYHHPDTDRAIDAINRYDAVSLGLYLLNVLENVAFADYPILKGLKEFFMQNGSIGALMSGSGPTVYGLYQDEILARIAYQTAQKKYSDCEILLCQTKIPE